MLGSLLRRARSSGFVRNYHEQRQIQNRLPQGLTWESLKRHHSLIPLFVIMGTCSVAVVAHCLRLIFLAPDINDMETSKPFKLMYIFDRQGVSKAPRYQTMTEEEAESYKYK